MLIPAGDPVESTQSLLELEALVSGLSILLADDSEAGRILILSALKRVQSVIEVAADGAIAVTMFRCGHYDLVLMDVEMPVLDGYEATREIRRFEAETGSVPVPVLALTSHTPGEMAVHGAEAGFTAFLTKPILNVALLQALVRYCPGNKNPAVQEADVSADGAEMRILARSYIAKRRADIPLYRRALEDGDFEMAKRMGHKTKGTGSGYGFPTLTELGGAIEQAALRADSCGLRLLVDCFALYVENLVLDD